MFLPDDFVPPCTAPFMSYLVDPDKTVRPCCVWQGPPLGDLKTQTISEILNGEPWQEVKESMLRGVLPVACKNCVARESTGRSFRGLYIDGGAFYTPLWRDGTITQIEYNASNICNLGCIHCNSKFSTGTFDQDKALTQVGLNRADNEVQKPDEKIAYEVISTITKDTRRIFFKGGEPMLNKDVALILEEIHRRGLLSNVTIIIVTNGTHTDTPTARKIYELSTKARRVSILLSIDGLGEVQNYIRYGKKSHIQSIEKFVATFSKSPNIQMTMLTSIMVCNVFYLHELATWWQSLQYPQLITGRFNLFVLLPRWLSFTSLKEETKLRLADQYESYQDPPYSCVIDTLRNTRTDEIDRKRLKLFLKTIDDLRGTDYRKSLPALAEELA